jgi:hypothetical protein
MPINSFTSFIVCLILQAPCSEIDFRADVEPIASMVQERQLKSSDWAKVDNRRSNPERDKTKKPAAADQPQLKNSALDRSPPTDKSRSGALLPETLSEWPLEREDKSSNGKNSLAKLVSQILQGDIEAKLDLELQPKIPFVSELPFDAKPIESEVITPEMRQRQLEIEECLKYYYRKPVNADALRPWSIMHGVLGFGQNSLVVSRGNRINAVDYLCHNGIGHDRRILRVINGKLSAQVGAGFQGHEAQLLAILAQVKTPIDHPLLVDGQAFTVRDLVELEKASCRPGTELTFKLIGLSVYLESEEIWQDSVGQSWDIARLMYEEMAQPINGAACGGTHRLMGLSYALAARRARNEPIDGQWKRAENFIANYHKQALSLQTSDGGFSTEFFEGLSNSADPIRQIYATGHILEWFSISMTEEQLTSVAVTRMVDRLLALMSAEYQPDEALNGTDVGPKGHALRALRLYELRLFGKPSKHQEFEALDKRPLLSASEIPKLQQGLRTVSAPTAGEERFIQAGSSSSSTRPSQITTPNYRGGSRFMRRR